MSINSRKRGLLDPLIKGIVISLGYAVIGKLGLMLAVPPGYATAIFPPSGLALAAILLFGNRFWPAIWFGSFLLNISLGANLENIDLVKCLLVPGCLGVGATLQALAGAGLIRATVGFPTGLDQIKDIIKFFLIGGLAACIISPTVGVTTLLLAKVVTPENYLINWLTWWVGDTLGVVVLTPLVLVWAAKPAMLWRQRKLSLALPLSVAFMLSIFIFVIIYRIEENRLQLDLKRRADIITLTLRNAMKEHIEIIYSLERLHRISPELTREEFYSFVSHTISTNNVFHALGWIPRVPRERVEQYIELARRNGFPEFQIKELDREGRLIKAVERPVYFPVFYAEPYLRNEAAVGYDLGSNPARREAMTIAQDTGRPAATETLMLVQERRQPGFLVFVPAYSQDSLMTLEERRAKLDGFALGVFKVHDMIERALAGFLTEPIVFEVREIMSDGNEKLIYRHDPQKPLGKDILADDRNWVKSRFHHVETLSLPGRTWSILFTPNMKYLTKNFSWQVWGALVGCLLFTGLLGAFLLYISGEEHKTALVVRERTAELIKANADLELQIIERGQVEEALEASEERFRHIFQQAPLGIMLFDENGVITECNVKFSEILEAPREKLIGFNMMTGMEAGPARWAVEETLKSGEGYFSGDYFTANSHKTVSIRTWNKRILSANGKFLGAIGIASDISAQKKSELALQESEEKYRILFHNELTAICIIDIEALRFIDVNDAFVNLYGYSRDDLLAGMNLLDMTAEPEGSKAAIQMALETGTHFIPLRYHRKKDGTRFPVEVVVGPYHWQGKRVMFIMLRDITKRRQIEERLVAALAEKEILLKEVHHRVKNNLQVIISLLNMQQSQVADERIKRAIQDSRDRIRAMALIHETLHRSNNLAAISLKDYAEDLVRTIMQAHRVKGVGVTVKLDFEEIKLAVDQAVPYGLILNELLTNALKYAFPGGSEGEIRIEARLLNSKEIELVVRDNGVGLPPDLDQVKQGSLGMSLVSILVEDQLLGSLVMRNDPGAVFVIRWPCTEKAREEKARD